MPTENAAPSGYIYLIREESDRRRYKIGYSRDPMGRLKSLQTGNSDRLKLVAMWEGTQADERALHERYRNQRLEGEWFCLDTRQIPLLQTYRSRRIFMSAMEFFQNEKARILSAVGEALLASIGQNNVSDSAVLNGGLPDVTICGSDVIIESANDGRRMRVRGVDWDDENVSEVIAGAYRFMWYWLDKGRRIDINGSIPAQKWSDMKDYSRRYRRGVQ